MYFERFGLGLRPMARRGQDPSLQNDLKRGIVGRGLDRSAVAPHLLWINFLSNPCFTAAFNTTHVKNTSMGSIVVFFTRPAVK